MHYYLRQDWLVITLDAHMPFPLMGVNKVPKQVK